MAKRVLNDIQNQAVKSIENPVLIFAGAPGVGSGPPPSGGFLILDLSFPELTQEHFLGMSNHVVGGFQFVSRSTLGP